MKPEDDERAKEALCRVLDEVQGHFRDHVAGGIAALPDRPESWGYVPWRCEDVVEQLIVAKGCFRPTATPRLLECGAGFGFVCALARQLGFAPTGLEIDARYVEKARELFPMIKIDQQDLLTYDEWASWDVVYYYAPFHDDHQEVARRFEEAVEDGVKAGAVIIANHKISERWKTDPRFEKLRQEGDIAYVLRKVEPAEGLKTVP